MLCLWRVGKSLVCGSKGWEIESSHSQQVLFCHNKLNLDLQPQLENTKFDTCGLDAGRFHGIKCKPVWEKKSRAGPAVRGFDAL